MIRCTKDGLTLEEVAPGIDIRTQILDQCDVKLLIPEGRAGGDGRVPSLRKTDSGWYRDSGPGGDGKNGNLLHKQQVPDGRNE